MNPEQLKDHLFECMSILNTYEPELATSMLKTLISQTIIYVNQQKNAAPVLVPNLCYEVDGDLLFASKKSR